MLPESNWKNATKLFKFEKPAVDLGRVQRDMDLNLNDIRFAIARPHPDMTEARELWWQCKAWEAEMIRLTDLAAARLEKMLEDM